MHDAKLRFEGSSAKDQETRKSQLPKPCIEEPGSKAQETGKI
jgi:hypothetical protein